MNPYPQEHPVLVLDNCSIHHNQDLVDLQVVECTGRPAGDAACQPTVMSYVLVMVMAPAITLSIARPTKPVEGSFNIRTCFRSVKILTASSSSRGLYSV